MSNLFKRICGCPVVVIQLICLLLSMSCQTVQNNNANNLPISNSFFPIEKGSFWKYVERDAIYPDSVNFEIDSVVSVKDTSEGLNVKILNRMGTGKSCIFEYLIRKDGLIYNKLDPREEKWYLWGIANPKIGEKVPYYLDSTVIQEYKNVYGNLPSIDKGECLCLESYSLDSVSFEQREAWHGIVVCKGVGIIFQGGVNDGLDLVQYRIGKNGKVINLPRQVRM